MLEQKNLTAVYREGVLFVILKEDADTLTVWNFITVHKDAAEDFVYEVIKTTFENVGILIAALSACLCSRL